MSRLEEVRTARAQVARKQATDDLLVLLRQPAFLRFLERLAFATHLAGSSFAPTGEEMGYLSGMRDVGRAVFKECADADPAAVGNVVTGHFRRLAAEATDDANAIAEDAGQ